MKGHPVILEEAGETELRRLSAGDWDEILDILDAIIEGAGNRHLLTGVPFDLSSPASIMVTFLSGLRTARKRVRSFLVSLLPEDVREQVTFSDVGTLITAATSHPDVERFFTNVRGASESPLYARMKAQMTPPETPTETSPES